MPNLSKNSCKDLFRQARPVTIGVVTFIFMFCIFTLHGFVDEENTDQRKKNGGPGGVKLKDAPTSMSGSSGQKQKVRKTITKAEKKLATLKRHLKRRMDMGAALSAREKIGRFEWRKMFVDYQTNTYIEVGMFTGRGDLDPVSMGSKISMEQLEPLEFKWSTEEPDAYRGKWELIAYPSMKTLANGWVNGKRGTFFIQTPKYLPSPQSQKEPTIYLVTITPYSVVLSDTYKSQKKPEKKSVSTSSKMKLLKTKTVIKKGEKTGFEKEGSKKTAVKPAGLPSAPVVITYPVDLPDPTWKEYRLFRKVELFVETIEMYNDPSGPGDEEFNVTGWFLEEPTRVFGKIPHKEIVIPEDDVGVKHTLYKGPIKTFDLGSLDSGTWPRTISLHVSVMEEDSGGKIASWVKKVYSVAKNNMRHAIHGAFADKFEQLAYDFLDGLDPMRELPDIADLLSTQLTNFASKGVLFVFDFFIGGIIAGIECSAADDPHKNNSFTYTVPTPEVDYIVKHFKGHWSGDRKRYKTDPKKLWLPQYACWPSATKYDGGVNIYTHLVFTDIETYMGDLKFE